MGEPAKRDDELEAVEVFRSRLYGVRGDKLTEKLKREGRHEWAETALVPQFVQEGAVTYDVGANIGYYTSLLSMWCGSTGKVHAFEANPVTASILEKTIRANKWPNVRLVRSAVSEGPGEVHVSASGLSAGTNIGGWRIRDAGSGGVTIPTVSLDEYRETCGGRWPAFVKVDVEGFEKHVIRGARQVLRHGAVFMVEFAGSDPNSHADCSEVAELFRSAGYVLAWINKKPLPHLARVTTELSRPPYHLNIFCLPKALAVLCR